MSSISNARWILLSQAMRIVVQLISLAVLSRLLSPAEYGLMAMCTVVMNFAYLLRDMGTAAAVIQRETLTDDMTSTVFWFNVGTGFALCLFLVLLAPMIAALFKTPAVTPVLWMLALVFPISSSSAVHQALQERGNHFRIIARVEGTSSLIGLIVALILAYMGLGVYALAFQLLAAFAAGTIQFWFASSWRPSWRWSQPEFMSLLGYSGNVTGFTIINYFGRNADSMIIGRVLGEVALGIYAQAYRVMMFPLQSMTYVANRALLPVMSRKQNEPAQIGQLYLRSLGMIATITAPLMAGLWLLRDPFVYVVLGDQWGEVATLLAWLAPVGLIQAVVNTNGTVFLATGRTDRLMRLGLCNTALQLTAFFIGTRWGIEGLAACYLVANLMNFLPAFYFTLKEVNATMLDLTKALWQPLTAATGMLVLLLPMIQLLGAYNVSEIVTLAVCSVVGTVLYAGVTYLISPAIYRDLKQFAKAN